MQVRKDGWLPQGLPVGDKMLFTNEVARNLISRLDGKNGSYTASDFEFYYIRYEDIFHKVLFMMLEKLQYGSLVAFVMGRDGQSIWQVPSYTWIGNDNLRMLEIENSRFNCDVAEMNRSLAFPNHFVDLRFSLLKTDADRFITSTRRRGSLTGFQKTEYASSKEISAWLDENKPKTSVGNGTLRDECAIFLKKSVGKQRFNEARAEFAGSSRLGRPKKTSR